MFYVTFVTLMPALALVGCQEGNLDQLEQETVLAELGIRSIQVGSQEYYLDDANLKVPVQKQLQMHIFGVAADSSRIDITNQANATWSSSIGSINGSGLFNAGSTAAGPGSVSVKFAGLTASHAITVIDNTPSSLVLWVKDEETATTTNTADVSLNYCDQKQFVALNAYTDSYWPAGTVTWSKIGTTAANIDPSSGLLTTADDPGPGTFTIQADDGNGVTGTRVITGGTAPGSLRIDPTSFNLPVQSNKSLVAYADYAGTEKLVSNAAIWTFTTPSTFATISGNVITGTAVGVSTIQASCGGVVSAPASVSTVEQTGDLVRLEMVVPNLDPDDHKMHLGLNSNATVSVTAVFPNEVKKTKYSDQITWTTSTEHIVDIKTNDDGTVTVTSYALGDSFVRATHDPTGIFVETHIRVE